jgi:hypothetical protein
MGLLRWLRKRLRKQGTARRKYGPTIHIDLNDPNEWVTDSNIFECEYCGTTALSDTHYHACSRCGRSMEKRSKENG